MKKIFIALTFILFLGINCDAYDKNYPNDKDGILANLFQNTKFYNNKAIIFPKKRLNYNTLSSYKTTNILNTALNNLADITTKQRYYSTFNAISYALIAHDTDVLKANAISKTNKKGYSAIAGINFGDNFFEDNLDKNIQGYNTSSYNAYFGFTKRLSRHTNSGLIGAYSFANTAYADNLGSRKDSLFQLSYFTHYVKNYAFFTAIEYLGFDNISIDRLAGNTYSQDVRAVTSFKADTKNTFLGTSLEYKKKFYLGHAIYLSPLSGLDASVILQEAINEDGQTVVKLGALRINTNITFLLKPYLGFELGKNLMQNNLNIFLNAKANYSLDNMSKDVSSFDEGSKTSEDISLYSKDSANSYEGDFVLGAKYSVAKNLLFQAKAQVNIGDKQGNANGGVSLTYYF